MLWQKRQTQAPVKAAAPSRALVPWRGERVDVDRFWAEAWVDLDRRQKTIARKLKIGKADWSVNQEAGLIQFERADGRMVIAPVPPRPTAPVPPTPPTAGVATLAPSAPACPPTPLSEPPPPPPPFATSTTVPVVSGDHTTIMPPDPPPLPPPFDGLP